MTQFFKLEPPPRIRGVIAPTEFVQDEDLQQRIVDSKMTRDYAVLLLVCSVFLILAIMI